MLCLFFSTQKIGEDNEKIIKIIIIIVTIMPVEKIMRSGCRIWLARVWRPNDDDDDHHCNYDDDHPSSSYKNDDYDAVRNPDPGCRMWFWVARVWPNEGNLVSTASCQIATTLPGCQIFPSSSVCIIIVCIILILKRAMMLIIAFRILKLVNQLQRN